MTVLSKKKPQAPLEECEPSSSTHGHALPHPTTQAHSQVNNYLLCYFIQLFATYLCGYLLKYIGLFIVAILDLYFNLCPLHKYN